MRTLLLTERELHRIISLLVEITENKRKFLEKRYLDKLGSDLFEKIIETDPTKTNKYSEWMMQKVAKKSIDPNDIDDTLAEYLILFDTPKIRNELPKKDIFQYKTIADLASTVEPYEEAMERGDFDSKPEVRQKTYMGRVGRFKVYEPTTYHQSCILGSGTEWCTAADSAEGRRHFAQYTSGDKRLLIFIDGDEKYQYGVTTKEFKDRFDEEAEIPKDISKWLLENGFRSKTVSDIREKLIDGIPLDEDELHIKGTLYLLGRKEIKELPDNLKIDGNLHLSYTNIESLPSGLWVGGSLIISNTKIRTLPSDLYVVHDLYASNSPLGLRSVADIHDMAKILGNINIRR